MTAVVDLTAFPAALPRKGSFMLRSAGSARVLLLLSPVLTAACSLSAEDGRPNDSDQGSLVGNAADEGFPGANITVVIQTKDGPTPACSGVLLTPTIVLTARSCVDPLKVGTFPTVRVGTTFGNAKSYFSTRAPLIEPGANAGSPGNVASNGQLALIYLDPKKPVLEEAAIAHQELVMPFDVGQGSGGALLYENMGVSGWSNPGAPGLGNVRQSAVFKDPVALVSNAKLAPGKPFWVRDATGSAQGLSGVDLGGPLFVKSGNERQVVGIAIQTGVAPGQVSSGACPSTASACDVWVDLTDEPNASWIRANLEIPRVLEGANKNSRWFERHSKGIIRPDGTPDWWYGEVDYTGPCQSDKDSDCDHWYDYDESWTSRDTCRAWFDPSQSDVDDDGVGDSCDNCPSFPNVMQRYDSGWGTVIPPSGRVAEVHETLGAKYPGLGCGLWGATQVSITADYGMEGIWARNDQDVWAVGEAEIQHWNGQSWSAALVSEGGGLYGVWGASSKDVWAVGISGKIMHYDGSRWIVFPSPTSANLKGIWGSGANDVWAVGEGTAIHWNGSTWSVQSAGLQPTGTLFGLRQVWSAGPNDVYAVGDNAWYKWVNGAWSVVNNWSVIDRPVRPGMEFVLYDIWGTGPNDIWVGGREVVPGSAGFRPTDPPHDSERQSAGSQAAAMQPVNILMHWNGTKWHRSAISCNFAVPGGGGGGASFALGEGPTDPKPGCGILSFHGRAWNDVWARTGGDVETGKNLYHFDGAAWSGVSSVPVERFVAMPDGLWGVSDGIPSVLQKRAMQWAQRSTDIPAVTAVTAADANQIFGFQSDNRATQWNGTAFSVAPDNAQGEINAAWTRARSDVWAVGANGTAVHFNGSGWASFATGTTQALRGVGGSSATDVWAVGDQGTMVRFNGTSWTAVNSGTTDSFQAVWASGTSDAWAATSAGTMFHWNGTAWSTVPTGTTGSRYTGIWGAGASDVWAVGGNGLIQHWDGSGWNSVSSPISGPSALGNDFTGIHGSGPGDVWAVTSNKVVHFDGARWSRVGTSDSEKFTDVTSVGAAGAWISSAPTASSGSLGQFPLTP